MAIFEDRDVVRWLPGKWKAVGVSRRTWRRWMKGESRIPPAVVRLARLLVNGDLGAIDPQWDGWILSQGRLWDIESGNQWHTTGTIRAWWWTMQRLFSVRPKRLQGEIREELHRRLKKPAAPRPSVATRLTD